MYRPNLERFKLSIPAKSYGEFESLGVSEVAILKWSIFKTPNYFTVSREMV